MDVQLIVGGTIAILFAGGGLPMVYQWQIPPSDCRLIATGGPPVAFSSLIATGGPLEWYCLESGKKPLVDHVPHQRHTGGNRRVFICHWCTTDDTPLSNNVASGPPATCWTSMWWATSGKRWRAPGDLSLLRFCLGWRWMVWAPLAAVAAVSGPPVVNRPEVGCVDGPLTVLYLVVETYQITMCA